MFSLKGIWRSCISISSLIFIKKVPLSQLYRPHSLNRRINFSLTSYSTFALVCVKVTRTSTSVTSIQSSYVPFRRDIWFCPSSPHRVVVHSSPSIPNGLRTRVIYCIGWIFRLWKWNFFFDSVPDTAGMFDQTTVSLFYFICIK